MKVVNVSRKTIVTVEIPQDELHLITVAFGASSAPKRLREWEGRYGDMPDDLQKLNNDNNIYKSLLHYLTL